MAGAAVSLKALLQRVLAEQFGGQYRAMGLAIGLDPAHTARLAKGLETSIGVETCLRLALICDLNPDEVLTLAGKAETARQIRRMYGKPAPVRAERSQEIRDWESLLAQLTDPQRKALLAIATDLVR